MWWAMCFYLHALAPPPPLLPSQPSLPSPPPDSPTLMSALSMNAASMAPVMLDVVLHTVGGGGGE